jgi:hypothetical protein
VYGIKLLQPCASTRGRRAVLALALLVLHHAAFAFEHLRRQVAGEEAHAVGLQVQGALQRRFGHILEEIGAIAVGGAVAVAGAEVVHRLAETVRMVLRAVEEEVLEQVREAGATAPLVARSDLVPDMHRDDRHAAILVHHHGQAVVQREGLAGDGQIGGIDGCLGRSRPCGCGEQQQGQQNNAHRGLRMR